MSLAPIKSASPSTSKRRRDSRRPVYRRKIAGATITIQRCSGKFGFRVVININGKRSTRGFDTLQAAKAYAQQQEIEAANIGNRAASELGDRERRALLDGKDALAPYGKTLADAVAFYLAHLQSTAKSAPVAELMRSLLEHKLREKASPRYLRDLRERLGRFAADFGDRTISEIRPDEISDWLVGLALSTVSVKNYRRCLAVLFNYAAERNMCPRGVMRQTIRLKGTKDEPGILSVAEASALLTAADSRVRAGLAIGLFCGIRDAELSKLEWSAVSFESGMITVSAGIAKVRQRRTIPMRPNLREWLLPLRQLGGLVIAPTCENRRLVSEARRAAGFGTPSECAMNTKLKPWPSNALRHSYASYRLAKWADAAELALEMGNSPGMILEHYRALVYPSPANDFWNLTPSSASDELSKVLPMDRSA